MGISTESEREANQDAEDWEREWARALERARADGVTIVPLGHGTYRTRSTKTPIGITYVTTVETCSCPATKPCKHLALVRAEEARLAAYWAGVREQRRQSAAGRALMAEAEQQGGAWRTVTGNGRIGKRAQFHRDPAGT